MNHLRRIISLLLVLVLCFGLIPGVSAAEVDTPGTDTQTEATEAEETVPTSIEDTQPTEEPAPEEPSAEDFPPEESIPDAERMLGLTARMYAMVIKVVIPPMTSVRTVVLFSLSLKIRSNMFFSFS